MELTKDKKQEIHLNLQLILTGLSIITTSFLLLTYIKLQKK